MCLLYKTESDTFQSHKDGVFLELLETEDVESLPLWLVRVPAGLRVEVEGLKQYGPFGTTDRQRERGGGGG